MGSDVEEQVGARQPDQDEFLTRFLAGRRSRWRLSIAASLVFLFGLVVLAASIGYTPIPPTQILVWLSQEIPLIGTGLFPSSVGDSVTKTIFFDIRLPRILGAILVGSALAASGTVLQDVFSNPLADPFVTGVSSGAALGAALAIVLGLGTALLGFNSIIALAFVGGMLSVAVSLLVTGRNASSSMFLLTGVTVTFLDSSGVAYLTVIAGDKLPALVFWLMGGLSGVEWDTLAPAVPIIVAGLAGILYFSRDLNAMLFGEEQSRSLGVNVGKVRVILIALTALVTATAVSISGIIGFVGLIIPHVMRLIVGSDHRVLLPSSIVVGSAFLLLSDTLARTIVLPIEVPVGVITAAIGGPFFIYLLRRQRRMLTF